MPRRVFRRRRRIMRRRKRNYKMVKRLPSSPFPTKIVRKMRTVQYVNFGTSTAGAILTQTWRANSIYDPEHTHGTQQPLGYDQYASLYGRYCVIGIKAKVTFHNKDDESWVVGTHISDTSTTYTTYEEYKELKRTQYKLLSPDVDKSIIVTKASPARMYHEKNPLAYEGATSYKLNATIGSNPATPVWLHLFAQPANQSSTTGDGCECIVELEQIVVLYDYKQPTRSTV